MWMKLNTLLQSGQNQSGPNAKYGFCGFIKCLLTRYHQLLIFLKFVLEVVVTCFHDIFSISLETGLKAFKWSHLAYKYFVDQWLMHKQNQADLKICLQWGICIRIWYLWDLISHIPLSLTFSINCTVVLVVAILLVWRFFFN